MYIRYWTLRRGCTDAVQNSRELLTALLNKPISNLPRRICRQKRQKIAEGLDKLDNEELHNLYSSSSSILKLPSQGARLAKQEVGKEKREMLKIFTRKT
jgi:hypothetical protein